MASYDDLFVRFRERPLPFLVVFRRGKLCALSRQGMFLRRRAICLLQNQPFGLSGDQYSTVLHDPVYVVLSVHRHLYHVFSAPFVKGCQGGAFRRVIYRLFLCVLVGVGDVHQVYEIGRSVPICKRVGRWDHVVPRATMVGIYRLLRHLRPIILLQVVGPTQASERVALNDHPLVTIHVAMLRFPVLEVSQVGLSNARREPIYHSNGSVLIACPTTSKATVQRCGDLQLGLIGRFVNAHVIVMDLPICNAKVFYSTVPTVATVNPIGPSFGRQTVVNRRLMRLSVRVVRVFQDSVVNLVPIPQ